MPSTSRIQPNEELEMAKVQVQDMTRQTFTTEISITSLYSVFEMKKRRRKTHIPNVHIS